MSPPAIDPPHPPAPPETDDGGIVRRLLPYRWELVALLWLCYFFNQADRQVYNVVLPKLQAELGLSDVHAGLVGSIFMWTYAALVPVAGYAGDAFRRKRIVFWSLLIWSGATLLSGASTGLAALVIFRGLSTGGGEAFYYPSANSLLGQYHEKTRALAMSIHQTSAYVGIVACGFIAGWIAEQFSWRMAFYAFGFFGIALAAVVAWRVRDVARPSAEGRLPLGVVLRGIAPKPTVWALCIAFAGFNFAGWGYYTWMPTYLHERFHLSLPHAGFAAMFYSNLAALLGVLVGGRASDLLARRRATARMEFEYVGLLAGAPFVALMGLTDNLWLCYLGLAGFGFCRGLYDSNLFAALFDVIEPRYRASGVGTMLAMAFVVSGFAPVVLGWAKSAVGLGPSIGLLALPFALSGAVLFAATRWTFARDRVDT